MAEIYAINMPKWGMEMSEGVVSDWLLQVGASVAEGDDLVDVETSKIVNTVTATNGGVLRAIVAQKGQTHAVGALLGVIADASVSAADIDAFIASHSAPAAKPAAAPAAAPVVATPVAATPVAATPVAAAVAAAPAALSALAEGADDSAVNASVVARRLAAEYKVNLHNVTATGHHGRVSKADLERAVLAAGGKLRGGPAAATGAGSNANRDDSDVHATPVARRLAQSLGINLHDCRVSGDRGRVCKADVEARAALLARNTVAATAPVGAAPVAPAAEQLPMSGMRKTIARRLQESKQTAPHFRVQVDVELDALLATRQQLNAANSHAKVSVNDFIVKACACALRQVPAVNIQFDGETITRFETADISVAVAIADGLITPIVRAVETKGLLAISNEVRDLATRAKIGRLSPAEFQGGSFCISNLGMFGVKQFDAIINPPQGAILAVGAGQQQPVVRNGQLAIATVMTLTLSSDHRVIDGAVAAQFMAALRNYLEQPATMLG